ncbi:DUF4153 domain-containing protein [Paenibacillus daejeonensis]|uniref:DUF4153 domain-containing protein n=1 Tax=Paenibacillus daejeonensis TaxID=135193 RepID=UPI000369B748|nr:DUF4173 domain-containing protein [Paenibacillus daejeonensis]
MEEQTSSTAALTRGAGAALAAALGLAVVHQYLFFGHSFGISHPLFLVLFYGYMLAFGRPVLRPMRALDWLLAGAIALLSLTFVLFNNPVLRALNTLGIPLLVFLQFTLLLSRRRFSYWDRRVLADTLDHLVPQSVRHWPTTVQTISRLAARGENTEPSHQRTQATRIIIGLAVAAPLLIVILSLLSAADGVFHYVLAAVPDWLGSISMNTWFWRIVWAAFMMLLFFTYVWGFRDSAVYDWERTLAAEGELAPVKKAQTRIDPLIAVTVLISISVVYVVYVGVQLSYLFGAWEGILPAGFTYADYARQGFAELMTVSGINLVLLLGTLYLVREEGSGLGQLIRSLLLVIVGCTGVMLSSAFSRLQLYEAAYGYTYARFFAQAFMLYVGALLLLAGLRAILRRLPLGRCFIIVSLVAYIALNYAQMDERIAAGNIERYTKSGKLDENYLLNLSTDATPLLVHFRNMDYPQLRLEEHRNWQALDHQDRSWQSFNWSWHRAAKALNKSYAEPKK